MYESEVSIAGQAGGPTKVVLEPWGDVQDLNPGAAWRLIARSPERGSLEVDEADGIIT